MLLQPRPMRHDLVRRAHRSAPQGEDRQAQHSAVGALRETGKKPTSLGWKL